MRKSALRMLRVNGRTGVDVAFELLDIVTAMTTAAGITRAEVMERYTSEHNAQDGGADAVARLMQRLQRGDGCPQLLMTRGTHREQRVLPNLRARLTVDVNVRRGAFYAGGE